MPFGRLKVAHANIEHRFERLKTIDSGICEENGANGPGKGALNAGVYLVKRKKDSKVCVEKKIPNKVILLREIHILRKIHHPAICEYLDAFISTEPPAASLYMEYCDLGTLDGVIDKYNNHEVSRNRRAFPNAPNSWRCIPETFIWKTFYQIADAMQYLHHGIDSSNPPSTPIKDWQPILHRDIKPSNIFIKSTPNPPPGTYPRLVLGDFGLSIQRIPEYQKEWHGATLLIGTIAFQSPQSPEHSAQGEVWFLGAVIQCMCRLEQDPRHDPPFGIHPDAWMENFRSRLPREIPECYSDQLVEVLRYAQTFAKEERPFAYQVVRATQRGYGRSGAVYEELPEWVFGGRTLE